MRKKAIKLRQFPLGGAKVNSTYIGQGPSAYFVVGDSSNKVRLFTFENQQQIETYSSNNNQNVQTEVTGVAISANDKQIFSGSNRGIINLWDMETAKISSPLKGHSTAVNCFGIFPDEPQRLASGSYDTLIKLWDLHERNCVNTLKGHTKPITSIQLCPDGNMLLSGSQDNTARLWDLRMTERPLFIANEHNGPIIKVKFNQEDQMFGTCSADKTAKYFSCEAKKSGYICSTQLVATPMTGICHNADGTLFYTAANDMLKCWNMYKNGLLVQSFETNWKGIQDITIVRQTLMGIAFSSGNLSLWVCDVNSKIKNRSRLIEEGESFVLPKIGKNYSKQQNEINMNEIQNMVGMAVQKVNNIQDKPVRDINRQNERKKDQMEQKRLLLEKKKEEMQRKKKQQQKRKKELEEQYQKDRMRKQKDDMERRERQIQRKIQENKRMEEKLYQDRMDRQRQLREQVKQTFQQNHNFLENNILNDGLQNSSLLNVSTFITDSTQKQKMRQFQIIGQILKAENKFQLVLKERSGAIKPIINFWRQGRITTALQLLQQSKQDVILDCTTSILSTPIFKQAITPQVGISLTSILCKMMITNKHSSSVRQFMSNINIIVLLFKEQLIKIKNFNPLTRVDISRQERLAKYDRLIQQFLFVFKQERLRKYYQKKTKEGELSELTLTAFELYKNLQQVLIKILPKQQPEPA